VAPGSDRGTSRRFTVTEVSSLPAMGNPRVAGRRSSACITGGGLLGWIAQIGPGGRAWMGELDGDGIPEIVAASWEPDAGYGSDRILVFDASLRLRAISDEFSGGLAWTGTHDLELPFHVLPRPE